MILYRAGHSLASELSGIIPKYETIYCQSEVYENKDTQQQFLEFIQYLKDTKGVNIKETVQSRYSVEAENGAVYTLCVEKNVFNKKSFSYKIDKLTTINKALNNEVFLKDRVYETEENQIIYCHYETKAAIQNRVFSIENIDTFLQEYRNNTDILKKILVGCIRHGYCLDEKVEEIMRFTVPNDKMDSKELITKLLGYNKNLTLEFIFKNSYLREYLLGVHDLNIDVAVN